MKTVGIPFVQEGTQMYNVVLRGEDAARLGQVAIWVETEEGETSGYQRAPEAARLRKVAQYLQRDPKPLMPTSVLFGVRGKHLNARDLGHGVVELELPEDEPLWIVDGQHRVGGLRRAIEEDGVDRLRSYPIPGVIVEFADEEEEANQFRVINETMKKINTQLARRLLALRVGQRGAGGRRAVREAGRLWEAKSVDVIRTLTDSPDSPWHGRIQPPNKKRSPEHVVRELSFSTSLKPVLTSYPYDTWEGTKVGRLLARYWEAWSNLVPEAFDDPNEYVIMKTPGVFSLHVVARYVLDVLRRRDITEPTVDDFQDVLKDLDVYATADYWKSGNIEGAAMAGSMAGFKLLADTFIDALEEAGHRAD
jgi:DGQHR domain-containing protein